MKSAWKSVELIDVCKLINGRAYNKDELLDAGPTPVLRVGNFFTNRNWYYSDLMLDADKYCDDGDLLYAWSASFGPRIWDGGRVIYHYHIWKIVPDQQFIDKKFLYYFLDFDKEKIQDEQGAGTTMVHVTKGAMEQRLLFLPPLPMQKRIVAILDEAFAGIAAATANAEKNLANARELFEATLSNVLTGNSQNWPRCKLEDMVEANCTLSYGIVQPGEEVAEGLPIVRPTDMSRQVIDLDGLKRIDPALAQGYSRTKLLGDELLLCVRGSTGGISIASSQLAGGNVTRGIVPIRFSPSVVSQKLGYYLLLSKLVQDQIREATYGTALMQINIRDLRQLAFIVPPLDDQPALLRELESIASNVQRLKELYEQKLTELADLKQAILQKAFSGELTALPEKALQEEAA